VAADRYDIGDFAEGHRVWAFHPWTLGVAHWATVTKVGRTRLYVDWHTVDGPKFIRPRDVLRREGAVSGNIT
jgi:hypothetical protein